MKYLFYKPFWISTQSTAPIMDEMEKEIRKGNDITLIGCNGELIEGCRNNPIKSKLTCNSCKYFRNKDLLLLSKKIQFFSIGDFIQSNEHYQKLEWHYTNSDDIKEIKFKGVEIGLAALSAYIQTTRNQSPKITEHFKKFFDKYLNTGALVTDAISIAIEKIKPDIVGILNGRIHTRRPVLNICQQKNIECNVFDHTGFLGENDCKKVLFKNCLPQDTNFLKNYILQTWEGSDLSLNKKIEIGKEYYNKKRKGHNVDDRSYVKSQIKNLLPQDWNNSKRNITIFNSSDDEFASLGEEWEYKLSESRQTTLNEIFNHFKNKSDFHFYLRIHPNLTNIKYKYVENLQTLNAFENLTVILPDSPISTYSLIDASEKIITFGSTVGLEAVFAQKPSILLNTSIYVGLDATYFPNSHNELFQMINEYLEPKDVLPALKYAFYRLNHGDRFEHFDPNPFKKREFHFKGKLIVSFNQDYREALYKGFVPSFLNFIKYKQASIPKNIWLRTNKGYIPKED